MSRVDPLAPSGHEAIEVHVNELPQLFDRIDPAPFRERDLDPRADEFIVEWAREIRRAAPLALVVHLDRPSAGGTDQQTVQDAVREHFRRRAESTRNRLRQLFRVGRTSLIIGVACLSLSLALGSMVEQLMGEGQMGPLLRESLIIGGWVAMWHPLEIFLYDWWPIRAEARLFERLSAMPARVIYAREAEASADAGAAPAPRQG
jgi:hypothetical protein